MTLFQNRYVQLLIVLLSGALLAYYFLPTKIEIRTVEKIVNRDVIVHQVKVIKPGQTTITTDSHDLSKETSKDESTKISGYNAKRLLVYGGTTLDREKYVLGASYNVWGPFDVGVVYQSRFFVTAGLRF